ncbi:MAG TPA: cytochrome c biogenesis heme-transporting ATPase CcmA [Pyrinomonadaceae bacterium]|nr:cytochrome c biogenesis heme-transporting ATPase CcmA [Pyrinomonadaceae bacterium]
MTSLSEVSYDLPEFDSIRSHLRNSSRPMLEVVNLDCVRGSRVLFTNLNLTVQPGALVQLQGANGSGKTSLLRIICGLLAPEKGEVRWQGSNIKKLGEDFATSLTYLGHRNGIKDELTPLENLRVTVGLSGERLSPDEAMDALARVGLKGREDLPARFLSEGQKRRAALARLITSRAKLWVLDEVLASLDASAVAMVRTLIEQHLKAGGSAIVATHQDMEISSDSFQRLDLSTLSSQPSRADVTGLTA